MADFRNNTAAAGSKGLSMNNPGNVFALGGRKMWDGQAFYVPSGEVTFTDTIYGYRAMAMLLLRYYNSYKLDTLNKIISYYAPASAGNDPVTYAKTVAGWMGITPDTVINVNDPTTLQSLLLNISNYEISPTYVAMIPPTDTTDSLAMLNINVLAPQMAFQGWIIRAINPGALQITTQSDNTGYPGGIITTVNP